VQTSYDASSHGVRVSNGASINLKPTVLIVTTRAWFATARLAMAFSNAGFAVQAICPSGHPISVTKAVQRTHPYSGLVPLSSFAEAIAAANPDLIVPGDDLATQQLHRLYYEGRQQGKAGDSICELIERSLGTPESFPIVYARSTFIRLAQEEGVGAPKSEALANIEDVRRWVAQAGFPTVLKNNGTSGGEGVRIVHTAEEAERAFRELQAPPSLARVIKRTLLDRDKTLILPFLRRRRLALNAQAFVAGQEATSLVACWKGTVLAGLHFAVVRKQDSTGPASVMRVIEHAEMASAAEKMVRRLNLSGLHGFDFMLETNTGNAFLIEINPRSTQVGHLALGPQRDLPAALYSAVTGKLVHEAPKVTENDTIALFPQEWLRNPASEYLSTAYHDVPWSEPKLMRACLRRPRNWGARYSQLKRCHALSATRRLRP
jgi:carbamoylphosphate synthase large subunit